MPEALWGVPKKDMREKEREVENKLEWHSWNRKAEKVFRKMITAAAKADKQSRSLLRNVDVVP